MNPRLTSYKFILKLTALALISGCGVKGDPLPPKQAPRLGRGHPTFTKASQQVDPEYKKENKETEKKKRKNQ